MSALAELPLVVELRPPPDVEAALFRLTGQPHCLLLDSSLRDPRLGRYSFLTADPFDYFTVPADGTDGLALVAQKLRPFSAVHRDDLPPFQGGAAGLLSYDLSRSMERIAAPQGAVADSPKPAEAPPPAPGAPKEAPPPEPDRPQVVSLDKFRKK